MTLEGMHYAVEVSQLGWWTHVKRYVSPRSITLPPVPCGAVMSAASQVTLQHDGVIASCTLPITKPKILRHASSCDHAEPNSAGRALEAITS